MFGLILFHENVSPGKPYEIASRIVYEHSAPGRPLLHQEAFVLHTSAEQ